MRHLYELSADFESHLLDVSCNGRLIRLPTTACIVRPNSLAPKISRLLPESVQDLIHAQRVAPGAPHQLNRHRLIADVRLLV